MAKTKQIVDAAEIAKIVADASKQHRSDLIRNLKKYGSLIVLAGGVITVVSGWFLGCFEAYNNVKEVAPLREQVHIIDSLQRAYHESDSIHKFWREQRADQKYHYYDSLFGLEYETIKKKW